MWIKNRLYTHKGQTTHAFAFGKYFDHIRGIDNHYRGWYDPVQNMVSVAIPEHIYKKQYPYGEGDIPRSLVRTLDREFPTQPRIKIF